MVEKKAPTSRVAQRIVKMDVVNRVTAEAIGHRAYSLFQAHGSEHGHDVEHWLVAEAELLRGNNAEIVSPFAKKSATRRMTSAS